MSRWGNFHQCPKDVQFPSTGKWVNKTWLVIHTIEYRSVKRNQGLICALTLVNPEKIMQRERGQSQKTTDYMTPLVWIVQKRQSYNGKVAAACTQSGSRKILKVGTKFLFSGDQGVLKLCCCIILKIY